MITTTLNAIRQTRHLGGSISTEAYDEGELEALFSESADLGGSQVRETQTLSPERVTQVWEDEFASLL